MATESFLQMSECLYESNWPVLAPNLQKYFVIMIGNTQQPIYYNGFGLVVLNLEAFGKVSGILTVNIPSKFMNSKNRKKFHP